MRINHQMLHSTILRDITNNFTKIAKLHEQGASGLKVRYPSDDAVVATRASNIMSRMRDFEQYKRNANTVDTYLKGYDNVTQEISSITTRVRELVVKGGHGTLTENDKQSISSEIGKLKEQLIQISNTNIGGNYIFGGADSKTAPVDEDGNIVLEAIADRKQVTNLGGYKFEYSFSAYDAFTVDGNESIFNLMDDIVENLDEDNPQGYLNGIALEKVEKFELQTQSMIAENGSSQRFLEMSSNRFDSYKGFLEEYLSKEQDADFLETFTNLMNQNSVLQASMKKQRQRNDDVSCGFHELMVLKI